jgi:hypothetical protein
MNRQEVGDRLHGAIETGYGYAQALGNVSLAYLAVRLGYEGYSGIEGHLAGEPVAETGDHIVTGIKFVCVAGVMSAMNFVGLNLARGYLHLATYGLTGIIPRDEG